MANVFIVTKASGNGFSLESGLADGQKHFDHHGEHSDQPAPCADVRIPVVSEDDVVEITHIDADTLIGLHRMMRVNLPEVDFGLMEEIDLNGSSVCADKFNLTLLYMAGVGQLARDLRFPRSSADGPIDVTEVVVDMMTRTTEEIIYIGREATEASEAAYRDCRVAISNRVGYWVIGPSDSLDPSRPYEDGVDVVVVHRTHYASLSIYCNPATKYAFGGQTVSGIKFAGHPKAAGSPRGVEFSVEDGKKVFNEISA